MIKEAILKLTKDQDISYEMAKKSMDEIMRGEASNVQMSSYLTALSMKGETIDEITASASSLRDHCVKLLTDMDVLEIVGTGGDGSNSFNISTVSAIVISAGGVPVAKHGNRAYSSKCGAADVLESLGVNIELSPEKSKLLLEKIGICFLYAQNYHLAMKYVAPVRKELGIPTIFNILGPLLNPAGANMELIGVYDEELVLPISRVIHNLGVKNGMVVYGQDKLDEISISAPTTVCEIKKGKFSRYVLNPEDYGFKLAPKSEITGGSPSINAQIALNILNGEESPKKDSIILNSGAGLYISGKTSSIKKGVSLAEDIIDDGKAKEKLDSFVDMSNNV
ncbi:MAG: anthranilate phosphoribosyltransferase [Methanobrevibacter sp.]|nr:anthranilate phosphoribosyltransferase [Candidatus Methanovirga aequatorialis]